MKKQYQQSFLKMQAQRPKTFFGGALLQGKRKNQRPLSAKNSLHFVMRSSWAKGRDSFLTTRNRKAIDNIITFFAKKFGVKIYERSINSNHIHLLLRITNRPLYRGFIKAVSGKIASQVMGKQSFELFSLSRKQEGKEHLTKMSHAGDGLHGRDRLQGTKKNNNIKYRTSQGFWEFRPFSRIVNWGRDFKACVQYLKQNVLEAVGFLSYKPRKNYYSKWLEVIMSDQR